MSKKTELYDILMKGNVAKLVDDFTSDNWICPECEGKPPIGRWCPVCKFTGTHNGGKIGMADYENNFSKVDT